MALQNALPPPQLTMNQTSAEGLQAIQQKPSRLVNSRVRFNARGYTSQCGLTLSIPRTFRRISLTTGCDSCRERKVRCARPEPSEGACFSIRFFIVARSSCSSRPSPNCPSHASGFTGPMIQGPNGIQVPECKPCTSMGGKCSYLYKVRSPFGETPFRHLLFLLRRH